MNRVHKTLLGLMAATTLFAGCNAEGTFESYDDRAIVEDVATHQHGDLLYVESSEELMGMLEEGELVFRPDHSFMGVMLNFSATQIPGMTYSYERLDGTWSEYDAVRFTTPESSNADANMAFTQMARTLRIRFDSSPEAIDFIRAEFVHTADPEAPLFLDDDWDHDLDAASGDAELGDDVIRLELSKSGRYIPPSDVVAAGRNQRVPYNGAGPWNGGRNCTGRFLSGTRKVSEYVKQNFEGARSFGGYNCRRIRGGSGLSTHGTGRGVDIFVPLDRGQADNDLGDPIANWLIENAEALGVQLVIWDRTIWNASRSGDKHRRYGGQHPHHDHLHVEFSIDGANERTSWFRGGAVTPPGGEVSCRSRTLNRAVPAGECVQMPYNSCGGTGTCQWALCTDQGAWSCTDVAACENVKHSAAACPAEPEPTPEPTPTPDPTPTRPAGDSCPSRTLNRDVLHGDCVQMNYNSCGGAGTCQWAACDDGAWSCTPADTCEFEKFGHTDCGTPAPAPTGKACLSKTLGRNVPDGEWVQMSYEACGGTCQWAACDDGNWSCGAPTGGVQHAHRSCR